MLEITRRATGPQEGHLSGATSAVLRRGHELCGPPFFVETLARVEILQACADKPRIYRAQHRRFFGAGMTCAAPRFSSRPLRRGGIVLASGRPIGAAVGDFSEQNRLEVGHEPMRAPRNPRLSPNAIGSCCVRCVCCKGPQRREEGRKAGFSGAAARVAGVEVAGPRGGRAGAVLGASPANPGESRRGPGEPPENRRRRGRRGGRRNPRPRAAPGRELGRVGRDLEPGSRCFTRERRISGGRTSRAPADISRTCSRTNARFGRASLQDSAVWPCFTRERRISGGRTSRAPADISRTCSRTNARFGRASLQDSAARFRGVFHRRAVRAPFGLRGNEATAPVNPAFPGAVSYLRVPICRGAGRFLTVLGFSNGDT